MGEMASLSLESHVKTMAHEMHALQRKGILCDVSLVGENACVEVHSLVLASVSAKLKQRVGRKTKGRKDSLVILTEYSQDVLDRLVHFMYTGEIQMTQEVAEQLQSAFNHFKLTKAAEMCEKFRTDRVDTSAESTAVNNQCSTTEGIDKGTDALFEVTSTNNLQISEESKDKRDDEPVSKLQANSGKYDRDKAAAIDIKGHVAQWQDGLPVCRTGNSEANNSSPVCNAESGSSAMPGVACKNENILLASGSRKRCRGTSQVKNTKRAKPDTRPKQTEKQDKDAEITQNQCLRQNLYAEQSQTKNVDLSCDISVNLFEEVSEGIPASSNDISVWHVRSKPAEMDDKSALFVDMQEDVCDSTPCELPPVDDQNEYYIEVKTFEESVIAKSDREPESATGPAQEAVSLWHVKTENSGDPSKFRCTDCLKEYKWRKDLVAHRRKFHDATVPTSKVKIPSSRKCSRCAMAFKTSDERTNHESNCTVVHVTPKKSRNRGPKRTKCDLCDYRCRTQKMKLSHMHNKHDVPFDYNNKDHPVLKCSAEGCGFETLYPFWLDAHKKKHLAESPYICETCGMGFRTSVGLRNHRNAAHDGVLISCDKCDKKYISMANLQTHRQRVHSQKKEFQCSYCVYQSFDLLTLESHMFSKHQVPYPDNRVSYSCEHCQYTTRRKNQYKAHLRRHTGETPYQCTTCSKSFHGRSDLTAHQKWHAAMTDRKHKCPYEGCQYAAILPNRLQDHIRQQHTHKHVKPFKCEVCAYQTNIRGNLILHLRRTHKLTVETKTYRVTQIGQTDTPVSSSHILAQAMREEGIPMTSGDILDSSGHVVGSTIENTNQDMTALNENNVELQNCDIIGISPYEQEGQGQIDRGQGHYVELQPPIPHKDEMRPELGDTSQIHNKTDPVALSLHDLSRTQSHMASQQGMVAQHMRVTPQGHTQMQGPAHMLPSVMSNQYKEIQAASISSPSPSMASQTSTPAPSSQVSYSEMTQTMKQYEFTSSSSTMAPSSTYAHSTVAANLHNPLQLPPNYASHMHYAAGPSHLQASPSNPAQLKELLYHPYWSQMVGSITGAGDGAPGQSHVNVVHDINQL